jgi:uncharacterized protein YkwD
MLEPTIDGQIAMDSGMSRKCFNGGFERRCLGFRVSVLGLMSLVLMACGGGSSGPTSPEFSPGVSEIEFQLLQLMNRERGDAGVDPNLSADATLSEVARLHSKAMRDQGFFGHTDPDGRTLRDRLEERGIDYSRAAENLAQVTGSASPASLAHQLLMGSDRHRDDILDPRFRLVGIGVSHSGDSFWITQIFIKP